MAREQPVVARDFLGLGVGMGSETPSGDVSMGKQEFLHVAERSPYLNASVLCNNMAMAGMKHSTSWNKAATIQQFLPHGGSCNVRFKEQITENLLERPFARFIHPLQMQDLTRENEKIGVYTQGDSLAKKKDLAPEDYCSSGGFQASATRNMISPSKQEAMAAAEMRLPSPGMPDMQHDAPLTIFYSGSVKVFNNISAEQAQAIIHLASVGNNTQSNMVDTTVGVVKNGTVTAWPQDKSVANLPSNSLNHVNQPTTTMQLDIGHLNIPTPSSPGPSTHEPMVPTALPHARKASLARFLEKRRERAHSKCPYGGSQEDSALPEERLSSSNDPPACPPAAREDATGKQRGLIPSWMLDSGVVKKQNHIVI